MNQEFSTPEARLAEGDEVAFLPPVSGGSGYTQEIRDPGTGNDPGNFFALTRDPIDGAAIARQLLRGEDGAFVNFEGVARNNTKGRATRYLEYECYESMAVKIMAQLGREIAAEFSIGRIAMVHRLGRIEIGETSVAVVVTAPHRTARVRRRARRHQPLEADWFRCGRRNTSRTEKCGWTANGTMRW